MPLFRKGAPADGPTATQLPHADFHRQLDDEAWRAARYGRPLAVISLAPRLLAGEALTRGELEAALHVLGTVRRADFYAVHDDGVITVVLPETDGSEARAVASRLRSGLSIARGASRQINWLVGVSALEGEVSGPELLRSARESLAA